MNSHDDKSSSGNSVNMLFHIFGAMCIFAAGSLFGSQRNVYQVDEMNGYNDRALSDSAGGIFSQHNQVNLGPAVDGIGGVAFEPPFEEFIETLDLEEYDAELTEYSDESFEELVDEDLINDLAGYIENDMTTLTPEIDEDILKESDFGLADDFFDEPVDDQTLNYDLSLDEESNSSRKLNAGDDATYHKPLACNENLESTSCSSFSELARPDDTTLVIPCGQCYEVDITDGIVDLPHGLRVEGKLHFTSASNVVFRTKFVFVLGLLKIDPPTFPNQVKFQLYQEDEVKFVANNADEKCGDGCSMGSKVIAVLGGKLDIRGYDESCPAWEKVMALGPGTPRPFTMPSEENGKSLELELNGPCSESSGHTKALGKYTVRCTIKNTALIRFGDSNDIKFTSLPPTPSESFKAPIDKKGTPLDLSIRSKCGRAGHTNHYKRCVVYCHVHETADISGGESKALTFTSVKPTKTFAMPTSNGDELAIKMGNGSICRESQGHTKRFKRTTVYCIMEQTFTVRGGPRDTPLKFTNTVTGKSFGASGVLHWAWRGKYMYFFPDVGADEVNTIFPKGSEMTVDYDFTDPGGQTMKIDSIHHWAWRGKTMYFFPSGYSDTECNEAANEMNNKFPLDYGIDISWNEDLIETGQEVTLSKGVHHWAWNRNQIYFHPDQTAEEINAKFPPGSRIKVSYGSAQDHYQIKVSPKAGSCWGKPGTELVLSSSTRSMGDRQLTTVTGYDENTGLISVKDPLEQPIITLEDSLDFAVEIAALNRPVVFEAESNADDAAIGGHLIIHETDVAQHVEGVEIKNFGQQGRLGRYPIHFHKCGDSVGSMVKRNVVRQSNQRCYVMHCSNDVTLEDNVAFDTVGHCYFLEDGSELRTTFRRNIAIDVKRMDESKTKLLGKKSKRNESDKDPAAFWISNAGNSYYGNIAAGSASTGYWFETTTRARKNSNLIAFEDNEVHSSSHFGFTTYPPGWQPTEINTVKNLKVYRNRGIGAFLHGSRNLVFEGGIFADNGRKAVEIFRADSTTFDETVFIGNTGLDYNRPSCSKVVGIDQGPTKLFEFETDGRHRGATLINTKFHNYTEATVGCESTPLKFNSIQVFTREFSAANRLENVQSDTLIDYDASEICEYMDNIIVEVSGDIHKSVTTSGNPGFLASKKVTTMLPSGACSVYNECLHWCEQACLRTVAFNTGDASMPDDTIMIAKDTTSGKEIIIERALRNGAHFIHTIEVRENPFFYAKYTAALPKGNFEIRFESRSSPGKRVWPGFARPVFEAAPICTNHIIESDLTFVKPAVDNRCNSLIYNGNFDTGITGWHGLNGNIWSGTAGVDGSGALKTTQFKNSEWISQYLESTCINVNDTYEISISYRLVGADGNAANACEGNRDDCPIARISRLRYGDRTRWDNIAATDSYSYSGFNTISGIWDVTQDQADADRINFVITGGNGHYIVDNVSITNTKVMEARKLNLRKK